MTPHVSLSPMSASAFINGSCAMNIAKSRPKGLILSFVASETQTGDNAPSILEINIKWKDLPPFGFHYKPKNIENHSDPRDCVKIHLIHIKKNCISKAERINCLGFQNADPKASCSEISGKPGNAVQVWYSPTVPVLIKPRDKGIFCRLVSHGRWPKQLLWTKCLHEIFGSVFCLTNPSTKSLLLQSARSRHTQISLLQSDPQEDAGRRWSAREAINH